MINSQFNSNNSNNFLQNQQQTLNPFISPNKNKSNLQESNYLQRTFCEKHVDEHITNFCTSINCFKPLCAECITEHIKQHQQSYQKDQKVAQIESIKNVKNSCQKKIKSVQDILNLQLEELENKNLIYAEDFSDEGILSINRAREKLINIVNGYFDNLEQKYYDRLKDFNSNEGDILILLEKIRNLMNELEHINANLESPNFVQNIIKVCSMDLGSVLENLKKDIKQLDKQHNLYSIDVNIDERRLIFITQEIYKYVQLGQLINHEQKQKIFQPLNNSNHEYEEINDEERPQKVHNTQFTSNRFKEDTTNPKSNLNLEVSKFGSNLNTSNKELGQIKNYNGNQSNYQGNTQNYSFQTKENIFNQNLQIQSVNNVSNKEYEIIIKEQDTHQEVKKLIHFFQNTTGNLILVELNQKQQNGYKIEQVNFNQNNYFGNNTQNLINQNSKILPFHKSIYTSKGQIYVIGGKLNDKQHSSQCLLVDIKNSTLIQKPKMKNGRINHSICNVNNKIYVIGGLLDNNVVSKSCECYDIDLELWYDIPPCNVATIQGCVCSFENQFLIKIGGLTQGWIPSNKFEIYDINKKEWKIINVQFDNEYQFQDLQEFKILNSSCSIQINKNEIFIFGGYLEDKAYRQSFILGIEQDENGNKCYEIKNFNQFSLTEAEGFQNNIPMIINKQIYALQNYQEHIGLEKDKRQIIKFDGKIWKKILQID